MKRPKSKFGVTFKRDQKGFIFLIPVIFGLIFIFIPSIVESIIYAFHEITFSGGVQKNFIGLDNFRRAFTIDPEFRYYIFNAMQTMVTDVFLVIIFSFLMSSILNQKFHGRMFVRTIFFLPVILSVGIVAMAENNDLLMGTYRTNTESVIVSAFASSGGLEIFDLTQYLLSSGIPVSIINFILNAVNSTYRIITASGVQILVFIAALQTIPTSVYESATVEGATKWEEFWKITFPLLTPMIFVNVVYTIVDTFSRPDYGILSYIQTEAFANNRMGYSAAAGVIYMVLVLAVIGAATVLLSKRIYYEN